MARDRLAIRLFSLGMEFYSTIAQLIPLLLIGIFLETRYASRLQARLAAMTPAAKRGVYYRVLAVYASGILPWLQLVALGAGLAAETLVIHVLAVGSGTDFTRAVAEYAAYLLVGVLVMGLMDIAMATV